MQSLAEQIIFFKMYHTNKTARLMHYIGIPLLLLGVLMLLSWFSIDIATHIRITFAWILVAAMLVYYYFLNVKLGVVMTVILGILTLIAGGLASPAPGGASFLLFLIFTAAGAALLYFSANYEPAKPTLTQVFYLLLIAPAALVIEALQAFKLQTYLGL